jgi:hypothetical protein
MRSGFCQLQRESQAGFLVLLADLPHEPVHDQLFRPAQEEPRRQTCYQAAA